ERSGFQPLIGLDILGQIDPGDDGTNDNNSVYVRTIFDVGADLEHFTALTLRMKYDDGFVAYLNGVEIARSNAPETVAWNSEAVEDRRDSSAPFFEDFDVTSALELLVPGENVLAIQGLNYDSTSNVMLVLPQLSATTGAFLY